jgi:hypothetical protein
LKPANAFHIRKTTGLYKSYIIKKRKEKRKKRKHPQSMLLNFPLSKGDVRYKVRMPRKQAKGPKKKV